MMIDKIKAIVKAQGLTYKDIATRFDPPKDEQYVKNLLFKIKKSEQLPREEKVGVSVSTLENLANALGVEVWELFIDELPHNEVNGFVEIAGEVHKVRSFDDLQDLLKLKDD